METDKVPDAHGDGMDPEGRLDLVERIMESYSVYYDVHRITDGDLVARMDFHFRGEQYMLTRRVNLWSEEDHEYVYLFSGESLDHDGLEDAVSRSLEDGRSRIVPGPDHRRSTITTLLVYGSVDEAAAKRIKRHSHHESYRLMLDGWMDHRVVAVDLGSDRILHGRRARDAVPTIRRILDSGGR